MKDFQFGNRVRQALNEAPSLDHRTAERLRAARELALQRHAAVEPSTGLSRAGASLVRFGGMTGFGLRVVLPLFALIAGLWAIQSWQQNLIVSEVVEVDAQLLTDDLPLDALLDKGFENFMKKRSQP